MLKSRFRARLAMLLIVPCIFFAVLIVLMSNMYLIRFFRSTQQDSLEKMSDQIMYSLTNSVESAENLLLSIESNGIIKGSTDKLESVMKSIYTYKNDYLKGVVFIGADGTVIGSPTTYWYFGDKEIGIIREFMDKKPRTISWSGQFYSEIADTTLGGGQFQPLSICQKSVYYEGSYVGVLAIVIGLTDFLSQTTLYNGNYDVTTYLYEEDGSLADNLLYKVSDKYLLTPVASTREELQKLDSAVDYLKLNNMYYSEIHMSRYPNWSVVVVGDIKKLESKFQPFNTTILAVIIAGFAGILIIYIIFIHGWFTMPMTRLRKGIRHVSGGDFDYSIEKRRNDEFGEIADEFNTMSRMVKKLIGELQEANRLKTESDMNVLLSQINPHFLYNTLDAINIMVDISPKAKVHEAFRKLVELLRYGLDRNQLRKLDEELVFIRNYIDLLKLRYGDLFDYRVEQGRGTGEVVMLKLLLQPLVENAVFHGLHPLKGRKGVLLIQTWLDGGSLRILISDNGVGMPEGMAQTILDEQNQENITGGIGVANVYRRIRLYYLQGYRFSIQSAEGGGTSVGITLPTQAQEQDEYPMRSGEAAI